jgi:hypothetical protein
MRFRILMKNGKKNYSSLVDLMKITEVKGFTKTINHTIDSGNEETGEFYLPHGILWEAKILLSYDYCSISHS